MKSFLKFAAIFLVILVLSAALAPILFRFLPFKFERIFNRLVMIFSLAAVFFFVRIRRDFLEHTGIIWDKNKSFHDLIAGFSAGVLTLALLTAAKIMFGVARWAPDAVSAQELVYETLTILGAALLIGVIEEFFFRGFVFSTFTRQFSWGVALSVFVTTLFYSLVHFVSYKKPFVGPEPTFFDSLRLIAAPFMSYAKWYDFWPDALGLFLFGWILNDLLIRTKSLYPGIGLHAGCVFFVKLDGLFVDFLDANRFLFSGKKMYDGILGWVFLAALAVSLRYFIKKRNHLVKNN